MSNLAHSNSPSIVKRLIDANIIPKNCYDFTLRARAGEALRFEISVYGTQDQYEAVAEALLANPEEARKLARSILIYNRDDKGATPLQIDLGPDETL